jgi:hypothetical protein
VKYQIYKITNKINGMIYVGCHITDNLNDSYMGSGTRLKRAMSEYGKDNFIKETLHVFDNKSDMLSKETEIVNAEFIQDSNTYNVILGGGDYTNKDYVPVRDSDGNYMLVHIMDSRYLSNELIPASTGFVTVKDTFGNTMKVKTDDERYLSGELVSNMVGCVSVKDKTGRKLVVDKDNPRYVSGEFVSINKDMVTVRDSIGNCFSVSVDDPRYVSGELVHVNKGKRDSPETVQRKSGTNNSQYGKCWITDPLAKINKKIMKTELDEYTNNGWIPGRKYYK